MNLLYSSILRAAAVSCVLAAGVPAAGAFAPDTYAAQSLLAEGRWVKISVPSTGIYKVTATDLRRHGFADPSAVRVMGYGGERISDVLTAAGYIDDLIPAPQEATADGIVFYGRGPESAELSTLPGGGPTMTHSLNPFSTAGYYFLTDASAASGNPLPKEGTAGAGSSPATSYDCLVFHELDQISPGESGHFLAGEDFRYTRSRTFDLATPDAVSDTIGLLVRFVAASTSQSSIGVAVNGTALSSDNSMTLAGVTKTTYARLATVRRDVTGPVSDRTSVTVTFEPGATVSVAALDLIDITYRRQLRLRDASLCFAITSPSARLDNADASTRVWDVTDLTAPFALRTAAENGGLTWTNSYGGRRTYVAWNERATLPSPDFAGEIACQNLHGEPVPDMVIFTPAEWRSQAERVAALHRRAPESLRVLVVSDQEVFNEFSSGTPDVGAFRRLLKMMYDRGVDSTGHSLRYAMLLGRASYDNRMLTAPMQNLRERTLVGWSTDEGLTESSSYCTDDILSLLEDGSGQRMVTDRYCIGVGRVPAGTLAEATAFVDKLYDYVDNSRPGPWKNRVMLIADDGDQGVHMEQTEAVERWMRATADGDALTYDKVYVDAYDEVGGISVEGRELMHRNLEEGTLWWNYIGHANKQGLTSERMLVYNDFTSVRWRRYPFLFAATCSFNRWDGIEKSGAELMLHNPYGGIIATLCPTREVYISENAYMSNAVARAAWKRDDDGRYPAIGDIYRMAKNNVINNDKEQTHSLNTNKLRYVLMGDPAMRLAIPEATVRVDSVCGEPVGPGSQPTLKARQRVKVSGAVTNPVDGSVMTGFSGTLTAVLYDAEMSVTSQGRSSDDTDGAQVTFERQGDMIFTGCCQVTDGLFTLTIPMPEDVADNFRPAALNLFAEASDGTEAISCFRSLYVYGYDEEAEADEEAPVIEYAYLNHPTFTDGDMVNTSPMFIARVTDNVGVNLSTAGVGRRMTVRIDGKDSYADLTPFYSPLSDGTVGGTLAYPLEDLMPGPHSLSFRVWDTSGNSATHTLAFNVSDRVAPTVFEVYTNTSPASTHADFYLSHNRPDADLDVTVEVYALNGRLVWSQTVSNRSDMFVSAPVRWDLCDSGGHRVGRGIYLYRATVTCDGMTTVAPTRRLAVTGR